MTDDQAYAFPGSFEEFAQTISEIGIPGDWHEPEHGGMQFRETGTDAIVSWCPHRRTMIPRGNCDRAVEIVGLVIACYAANNADPLPTEEGIAQSTHGTLETTRAYITNTASDAGRSAIPTTQRNTERTGALELIGRLTPRSLWYIAATIAAAIGCASWVGYRLGQSRALTNIQQEIQDTQDDSSCPDESVQDAGHLWCVP